MPTHSLPRPPAVPLATRCIAVLGTVVLLCATGDVRAQLPTPRSEDRLSGQRLPSRDSATAQVVSSLPDSIVLYRYDPSDPQRQYPVTDSALDLRYVRFDRIQRAGPDFVYLNNLVQPATTNPLLGAGYQQSRRLLQPTHPAYESPTAPFFGLNVPYAYAAYNQGGEIDDGQVDVLFGAPFANGYNLGFSYLRTYQAGRRNRYPAAQGERIRLGATLSYLPDSSRHRAYASLQLRSWGYFNPGGYSFAADDTISVPELPLLADPDLEGFRTEGSESVYAYRHRYFLRPQYGPSAEGWAGSVRLSRKQIAQRTAGPSTLVNGVEGTGYPDLAPFEIDDRGSRYAVSSVAVLAQADLEYYTEPATGDDIAFDFRAGVYGGTQRFQGEFYDGIDREALLGIAGGLRGEIASQFALEATADLALGSRAGQGKIQGELSWQYRDRFGVSAFALLERSDAPWAATTVGVNDSLLLRTGLPVGTHTILGGSLRYAPLATEIRAYLEVFADGYVYDAFGFARAATTTPAIPTLSYETALRHRFLRFDLRGVLRSPSLSAEVYLPSLTGQQSLYAETRLFKRGMTLIGGVDTWIRSPVERYAFAPLTNVFHLDDQAARADWQYTLDVFLAFKVQSFKAFVKLENAFASLDGGVPPQTVQGYPIVRGPGRGFYGDLLRLGISFSLYN